VCGRHYERARKKFSRQGRALVDWVTPRLR
jgi:hypothetical protein